jgi:hypothetical protein
MPQALGRLFRPRQVGLGHRLAGRAAVADVGRQNVLAVADVDVPAHEVRAQDFRDVGAPRGLRVATLVDLESIS